MSTAPQKIFSRDFVIASVICLFISLNFFTLLTTIPGYAFKVFQLSGTAAGLATGLFVAGMMVSRLIAGRLVNRIGFHRMLFLGIGGLVLFSSGYFVASTPLLLYLVRICNGFAYGMTANTCVTVVSSIVPRERSGEGVGYYTMFQMIAWAIGPYTGVGLSQAGNYTGVFAFCTILPAVGLALVPFLKIRNVPSADPAPERAEAPAVPEAAALDSSAPPGAADRFFESFFEMKVLPAVAACLLLYIFNSSITAFLAVYSETIGLAKMASYYFLVYVAALLATRPFVGKLVDRRGPIFVLYPGIVCTVAALLILSQLQSAALLFLTAVLYGLGGGSMLTATVALSVKLAPRHRLGVANATYFLALDFTAAVGPVVGGTLITYAGYREMYFIGAVYCAVGFLVFHLLFGRKLRHDRSLRG